jgi:hypothetical protein
VLTGGGDLELGVVGDVDAEYWVGRWEGSELRGKHGGGGCDGDGYDGSIRGDAAKVEWFSGDRNEGRLSGGGKVESIEGWEEEVVGRIGAVDDSEVAMVGGVLGFVPLALIPRR